MKEKLLPFNLQAEYVPGKEMLLVDYGSRAPLIEDGMEEFRTPNIDIDIKIKSHRVRSLNIKDPSIEMLAALALENTQCRQMVNHLELLPWFYSYGMTHKIRLERAGTFRDVVTRKLERLGI